MSYAKIEKDLKENNFKLDCGTSPLEGMKFSNDKQIAFVFAIKENDLLKTKVEYFDITTKA